MLKFVTSSFSLITLSVFLLSGCSNHKDAMKVLPNELSIADDCRNTNKKFEMDCYDLISYKNSFAQLRLGLNAKNRGNYSEALQRYNIAKQKGNFYSNFLLSELYRNGLGVAKNEETAIDLLEDVKEVDPIAAYKLAFHYIAKNKNEDAIELLTYSAINNVKVAQYELAKIYSNGSIVEADSEKSLYWNEQYEDKSNNFVNKIYGI